MGDIGLRVRVIIYYILTISHGHLYILHTLLSVQSTCMQCQRPYDTSDRDRSEFWTGQNASKSAGSISSVECVYSVLCVRYMHTFSIAVIKLLAVRAHSMVPLFISLETDSIYPFLLVFAMTMVQTKSRQNTGNCRIVMSPSKSNVCAGFFATTEKLFVLNEPLLFIGPK